MDEYVKLAKRAADAYVLLSTMRGVALKAWNDMEQEGEGPAAVKAALEAHQSHLLALLPEAKGVSNLGRHIHFNCRSDYWDIVNFDIPAVEAAVAKLLSVPPPVPERRFGFEELLHPKIKAGAYRQYADGHYREAVINAYTDLFVEIRSRTGRQEDGPNLADHVLSLKQPVLVVGDLSTESGRNRQQGFMFLLKGAWMAFRSVLVHRNPDVAMKPKGAARHLVNASLLMSMIGDAKAP